MDGLRATLPQSWLWKSCRPSIHNLNPSAIWNTNGIAWRCRMFLKRFVLGLIAIAILLAAVGRQGTAQQARPVTVQLLAINDFHGNLDPPTGSGGLVNQTLAGGVEYLATHLRIAARDNPNSILVGAGDLMGASPLVSGLLHDGPTIEAMNAMNMSVKSIGKHELDHGPAEMLL